MERYGLFKKLADGSPMWVCAVANLPEGMALMYELARETGLEHFIHDFHDGVAVATSRDGKPSTAA